MQQVDIAIVGGGMVGLALANALSESELDIAIISDVPLSAPLKDEWGLRVSAINAANAKMLRQLNAWQNIEPLRVTPYYQMHVWDKDSFGRIEFDCDELMQDELGFIVENQALVNALAKTLASTKANVHECKITRFLHGQEQSVLMLENDEVVSAKLVVGADGANSFVRRNVGFPLTFRDYDHTAIVANVEFASAHQQVARQIFTPTGPLALLPLSHPHQCAIVWSQDTQAANALNAKSDEDFAKALTVASEAILGGVVTMSPKAHFPLTMRYARQWVDDGVAIIGDAAHTIHPLAGQGANLGIQDAFALANAIKNLREKDKPINTRRSLRPFERARKSEAIKMIASMDGFKHLFAGNHPLKKIVRGVGLSAVDALPAIKRQFVATAMGLD